ncbi:peptide-methionine (R)-S-oxide reductase MsrB [Christiangramia forsetii]|uniref:peptide-methionine (R)-S-oxide reductase n=2 Tax=Christiangramia forsetii TaxID=411153 RepID=A0M2I7_CHRFK|nr:peptide-methionine (R)-S-oxide reductase MsrB [Christiangramia forsetii]GGG39003.1 peptide-methionine (R)-S-oxide reductase [Christiangramia forsetii]CAL66832.1 peptide methionine sulfoxide reductase [Christiangramia forsetii KT0803]
MKKLFLFTVLATFLMSCNGNAQKTSKKSSKDYEVSKTESEWKEELTSEEFDVLRKAATERPFSSELNDIKKPGTFVCAACGNELYKTEHKFMSGTGWPSFDRPIEGGVAYGSDSKLGYQRDEVHCARCGGHLGHVFNDGPKETTGKRHCINGIAMDFNPENE